MSQVPPPPITGYPRPVQPNRRADSSLVGEAFRFPGSGGATYGASAFGFLGIALAYAFLFAIMIGSGQMDRPPKQNDGAMFLSLFGYFAIINSAFFYSANATANLALQRMRGSAPNLRAALTFNGQLGQGLLLCVLHGIGLVLLGALCFIPGIVFAGSMMLSGTILAEKRVSAVQAMEMSWQELRGQRFHATITSFALNFIAGIGVLIAGVGVILTLPIYGAGLALLYERYFPSSTTPEPARQLPTLFV